MDTKTNEPRATSHEPPIKAGLVPLTRERLAQSMGISYDTLRRRLLKAGLNVPCRELLSPRHQCEIRTALGYE